MPKKLKKRVSKLPARQHRSPTSVRKDIIDCSLEGRALIQPNSSAQHGTVYNPKTKRAGVYALADGEADRGIAEVFEEEAAANRARRWVVRAIFGFHRNDDETLSLLRKVGVFTILPSLPPADLERRLVLLPWQERQEAMAEIVKEWKNIHEGKYFFVDDLPPLGNSLQQITRGSLIELMLTLWRSHPVNTTGDIELVYPDGHIEVKITREILLNQSLSARLFEHVSHILNLMGQGFKYDPRVHLNKSSHNGALRRVGKKGPEPWSRNR